MPDQIQSYKVICNGGLNSNENHLDLSDNNPGAATRLVNYEVSLFGGYRRIEGFAEYNSPYAEVKGETTTATGPVLCTALYEHPTLGNIIIAARKDPTTDTYSFYRSVLNNHWVKYSLTTTRSGAGHNASSGTPLTRLTTDGTNTVNKVRFTKFNFGDGNRIVFVDGVNPAIVFDGTSWEVILQANTGGASSPGGANCLDKPALVDNFENHLFLSGDTSNSAVVAYSAPSDPFRFDTASGAGQLVVGFDVVQFKPFRTNLFIFGDNAIKKATPDVTAGFVIDNVTANVGCVARDSVVEIGGDLIFLSPDGFRPVAGTSRIGDVEIETISKNIQQVLGDLSVTFDLTTLNAVVIRSKSQVRFFIGDETTTVPSSFGIIGGLRSADQKLGWEFGTLLGIRASCCDSAYIKTTTASNLNITQELVVHGDYDGKVYQQEVGKTFNGVDILSVYSTPYFDLGDTETRKIFRKVNAFVRAEGPLTMQMGLTYDWDDPRVTNPAAYSQDSAGAPVKYGALGVDYADRADGTIDPNSNVIYGGTDKPIITTSIQGSGYAIQLTFVTLGAFDPYSIQGMVFEFSVAGRR